MEIETNNKKKMKMKRLIYIIYLLTVICVLGACTKDDYLQYDVNMASVRFVYPAYGNDSTVYSFALHPGQEEGEVTIPVKLIGLASSSIREFGVDVVKEQSTAIENEDFVIVDRTLQADSIKGVLKVKVKKTTSLDSHDLSVTFRLSGNSEFSAAPINESTYKIVLTNQLTKPVGWPFGEYSRIKHEFVISVTGVGTDYDKWSTSDRIYWTGKLNEALYEYNKEHPDNPLRDENGMLITF